MCIAAVITIGVELGYKAPRLGQGSKANPLNFDIS